MNNELIKNQLKLKSVLKINAVFSLVSGILMILMNQRMVELFAQPPILILGIGFSLLFYVVLLSYEFRRTDTNQKLVLFFAFADLLWVVGSGIILSIDGLIPSMNGKALIALIADIILVFSVLQFYYLNKISEPKKLMIKHR